MRGLMCRERELQKKFFLTFHGVMMEGTRQDDINPPKSGQKGRSKNTMSLSDLIKKYDEFKRLSQKYDEFLSLTHVWLFWKEAKKVMVSRCVRHVGCWSG